MSLNKKVAAPPPILHCYNFIHKRVPGYDFLNIIQKQIIWGHRIYLKIICSLKAGLCGPLGLSQLVLATYLKNMNESWN